MRGQKKGQAWNYVQLSERHTGAYTQATCESGMRTARSKLRLFHFFDRPAGVHIEVLSSFSRRHGTSGSHQQTYAQPLLELRNALRDGRLTNVQVPCGCGERSGLQHADECGHRCETVHMGPNNGCIVGTSYCARVPCLHTARVKSALDAD